MADWTDRDSTHLGTDVFATSTTAQALYDNPIAIAEGAPGAPRIQTAALDNLIVTAAKIANSTIPQSKMAAAAIGQTQLKTSTGDVSAINAHVTLPGGQYGFYPQTRSLGGAGITTYLSNMLATTTFVTNIYFESVDPVGGAARQRYVTASPPYDLGDGDVPLFVFVALDSNGKPTMYYIAEDPPWAYNGPTDIQPDAFEYLTDKKTGQVRGVKKFKRVRRLSAELKSRLRSSDPVERAEALAERAAAPVDLVEITQAFKNSDMPLIPHPFTFNDLTGKTVVLLDPMCKVIEQARALHRDGEDIGALLTGGLIRLDNVPLARRCPQGVMPVAPKWRDSR